MISLKEYNLESFKDKDLYTIEEIVSRIEDLECENHVLKEKLEEQDQDEPDRYEDYRLGLI